MDYYIFNENIRNIEKVEIEKEFSDTYVLKDKSEEYDYKTLERLNLNLNYSDCLLDPNLKKYSNPSPFGIDDQLYQKQFSKTMEDDSLVSNFGIEFNHQPIESRFFS